MSGDVFDRHTSRGGVFNGHSVGRGQGCFKHPTTLPGTDLHKQELSGPKEWYQGLRNPDPVNVPGMKENRYIGM